MLIHRITRVLLTLLIAGAGTASAQPLPADVVPDQYDLRFTFDLSHGAFTGSEQILVNVEKSTNRITLNAVGLSLRQAIVISGFSSQPATISTDEGRQTATLTLKRKVAAGPARIRIEYGGRLGRAPRGLFTGTADGRNWIASQFEPTDARRALPCFDQPDMKASFLVTAVVPADAMVISNGRPLSDSPGPSEGEHTVKFATTRKMPTYAVALAVGAFDCVGALVDQVPLRVCALRGRASRARFAADAAQAFLRFYDAYFAVKYPFGKLDVLAIPDFPGGMENVGAIFAGEHDLLVDEATSRIENQKRVAVTIAHEIAHQWIGDLVTMKWWDDLWLKEGLATFFETKPLRAWKPEWHGELDEVSSAEDAMAYDGLDVTHAARTKVTTPAEINELYDAIVYQKAGAVLRMVEGALGSDTFRLAVNTFIKRFSYSNATGEDLRATLAESNAQGVDQVLRTFIEQPGVPVVSVTTRCLTEATSSLSLAQRRFSLDAARPAAAATPWAIPVTTRPIAPLPGVPALATSRLLTATDQSFDLAGCNELVLANADALGYFRTIYPPQVLARLTSAASALTPAERLRLVDDQWALARSGALPIGDYLTLIAALTGESNAAVIDRVAQTLRNIEYDLATDENRDVFRTWVRVRFAAGQPAAASAAADGNRHTQRAADAALASLVGGVGRDPETLERARASLTGDSAPAGQSSPELLHVYTRLAAGSGGTDVLDRVVAAIERGGDEAAYERNVQALGEFSDPAILSKALDFALSERVQGPGAAQAVAAALANPAGRITAWAFLKAHWRELLAKSGEDDAASALFTGTRSFCDAGLRDEVRSFLAKEIGPTRTGLVTLAHIQSCIDFQSAQRAAFQRWVSQLR